MALTAGTRIGPYTVTAPLGEGGMGIVFRAHDTKLQRDVALKLLPEHFAENVDRLLRFQREAQVLASLNHPNIAQIYGVEDRALVMELVEGESPKGPMPFDEAWKIAVQIADALEYAHEKRVVHRDLKPANIKVTPDGVVKLLDFGLAKAFTVQSEAERSAGENSPVFTLGPTEVGVILGTAGYMAPEQAKGEKVNKRADIWSWGVVLYELLTGERMFKGDEVADTLAQVLTKEPDLERVAPQVHKLLRRCLEKDPKQRLHGIGDVRDLLEDRPAAVVLSPSRLGIGASIAAGVLLLALGIFSFLYFRATSPPGPVQRYTIAAPLNTTNLNSFAISPDGRYVAIAAQVNGKFQLWLRALDALEAQPMPGTDDATYPFWSPDSRHIAFFAQGKLKKIDAGGGPAQSLCDAPFGRGGSWNREGLIVFSSGFSGNAIQRISAAGGGPANVTKTKGLSRFPVFLPDGRHFLYLVTRVSVDQNGIYLSSLDGEENRRVLADESSVVFAAGRLLFVRENTLMAQSFDAASGKTMGEVSPVAEGVSLLTSMTGNYVPVTASDTGVLLYARGGGAYGTNQMAWYDRAGKLRGTVGPGREPAISPDEKSVVFRRLTALGGDLWLQNLARGAEQRFTTDPSFNQAPVWSPQGDRIAFSSNRSGGVHNLYQKAASATGQDDLLLADGNGKVVSQWSRDGRFIVYSEFDPKTKWDIWVLPIESGAERKPVSGTPFLRSEFNEVSGQLSPDSHWMAYTSDESGQREVHVRPFPAAEGQWKISLTGGEQPRWRGDGDELFFVGADGKMMAVAVKAAVSSGPGTKPSFEPGAPQQLFETHLAQSIDAAFEYDVTADGKRFLLDTNPGGGSASAPPLNVVVNWSRSIPPSSR